MVEFIWHPLKNNPLDNIGRPLVDSHGVALVIGKQVAGDFYIERNNQRQFAGGNIAICYLLNQIEARPQERS